MDSPDVIRDSDRGEIKFVTPPEPKWEWCISGDWYSMTVHTLASPHWFARVLQKWLLDIHWRRIVPPPE